MDIPKETERLMKIYNSMSKEEFSEFVRSSEQAQSDMKITIGWLEEVLEPMIKTVKEIANSLTDTLRPIANNLLANKEALISISRVQSTMNASA